MTRATREAWFTEGFDILTREGEASLTIAELCKRLGVTRGSFYHHFESRESYSAQLLAFWEKELTRDLIELLEQTKSYSDQDRRITRVVECFQGNIDLEIAIRAWALRDPTARFYQERVDSLRLKYLRELHEGNHDQAKTIAELRYALFVGASQIVPSIRGERYLELRDVLAKLLRDDTTLLNE